MKKPDQWWICNGCEEPCLAFHSGEPQCLIEEFPTLQYPLRLWRHATDAEVSAVLRSADDKLRCSA